MPGPTSPGPLSIDEAARVLERLRELVGNDNIVLIGGAAVSLWHDRLLGVSADPHLATGDLDFQGGADAVRLAARLLGGRHRIARLDDHSSQTGAIAFQDSAGRERIVDFLTYPYGLDARGVERRAIPLDVSVSDGPPVRVHVMNPIDCLRSRVANTALPGRPPEHSNAQLSAAIALVPAYGRLLLDQGANPRKVTQLNERVYDLALRSPQARKLYAKGVDVARAELDDSRLPYAHRTVRLPQLRARLAAERQRLATASASLHPPGDK